MWFSRLVIERLRNLTLLELDVGPGLVVLQGGNGAGKSSVLEAISLLGMGRSFRAGHPGSLIQRGAEALSVFAEMGGEDAVSRRLGFSRAQRSWSARCDGENVNSLASLARACPVACFEPGAHGWIVGPAQGRRRLLDWVVFHVEHEFLKQWSRYRHALQARNCLLRDQASNSQIDAWDQVLLSSGTAIETMRRGVGEQYCAQVLTWWSRLNEDHVDLNISLFRGWSADLELAEVLSKSRSQDRELGYTRRGPHRADLVLQADQRSARDVVSRGQQKTLALCLLLAQIDCVTQRSALVPVLLLDDFPSELDRSVQHRVLHHLNRDQRQIWLTGTSFETDSLAILSDAQMFHVEQGQLRQLV